MNLMYNLCCYNLILYSVYCYNLILYYLLSVATTSYSIPFVTIPGCNLILYILHSFATTSSSISYVATTFSIYYSLSLQPHPLLLFVATTLSSIPYVTTISSSITLCYYNLILYSLFLLVIEDEVVVT